MQCRSIRRSGQSTYISASPNADLDSEIGGLVSYGFDTIEQQHGIAIYVGRIRKGEKAGDLPVQAPTKYELVINLKAAKALGLDVSPQFQQRADEVIE